MSQPKMILHIAVLGEKQYFMTAQPPEYFLKMFLAPESKYAEYATWTEKDVESEKVIERFYTFSEPKCPEDLKRKPKTKSKENMTLQEILNELVQELTKRFPEAELKPYVCREEIHCEVILPSKKPTELLIVLVPADGFHYNYEAQSVAWNSGLQNTLEEALTQLQVVWEASIEQSKGWLKQFKKDIAKPPFRAKSVYTGEFGTF